MLSPIYVASKDRADKCLTVEKLLSEGNKPNLVIEPQDVLSYKSCQTTKLVLEKDDQGIAYARNFILEHARRKQHEWIWMLDDDIKEAYLTKDKKNLKNPLTEVLMATQRILQNVDNMAVGALEYQQYAWSAKKDLAMNSYCDVAVLINLPRTLRLSYRDGCKEDRDFVLQAISSGFVSARSSKTSFSVPKNGSNKGGLHDAYAKGLEKHWSKKMVELWPGICELKTKPDGRPDVKIHWKLMR